MLRGYIDAAIYVVTAAASFVFLKKLCNNIDPFVIIFVVSVIATLHFNLVNIGQIKATYRVCLNNKLLFLLMSGSLGIDWVCGVYAAYFADPFISLAVLFIFLAIIGFGQLFLESRKLYYLFSMLLLILSIFALYYGYTLTKSQYFGIAIILGAVGGISFYIYIASSYFLSTKLQVTNPQILATRFLMLVLVAMMFISYKDLFHALSYNFLSLLAVAYGSSIIPVYYSQRAIVSLGSGLTSVLFSFVPPLTYFFNALYNHSFILNNLIVCLIITVALTLPNIIKYLKY